MATNDPLQNPLWNAKHELGQAYESSVVAYSRKVTGGFSATYENFMLEHMTRAADALGYDLVKRSAKQEAA